MDPNQTPSPAPMVPEQTAPVTPTPAEAPQAQPSMGLVSQAPQANNEQFEENMKTAPKLDPKNGIVIRYPFLIMSVLILHILAIVFIIVGLVTGIIQLFAPELSLWYKFVLMFFYMMIGFFNAMLAWTLAEVAKAMVDIEAQTRPKSVDDRLRMILQDIEKK